MEKKKIVDFIDALGMEGLLVSVGGITPCKAIMSLYTDAEGAKIGAREVRGVTYNSKEVKEGFLFVAKGAHFKEQYLEDAIAKGAVCFVREDASGTPVTDCSIPGAGGGTGSAEGETAGEAASMSEAASEGIGNAPEKGDESAAVGSALKDEGCLSIYVSDIRKAMPAIAETFYGKLSDELKIVGITGTKGKSTTSYFMRYIIDDWMEASGGRRSAICSGIDNYDGVIEEESHLTTPEIMELYQHMNNALSNGISHMTMEVSSQALKYDRVTGVEFEAGAFLNIGSDHISPIEHPDFEDYLASKLRIFGHCRKACYCLESDALDKIEAASADCPYVITFSQKDERANVFGYDIRSKEGHVSFRASGKGIEGYADFDEEFTLGTFGTINVENALAAISLSALLGVPMDSIKRGLSVARSPGRMEVFYSGDKKRIAIVDYAHNTLSYEKFFETIKDEFPGKKVMIVFGCPGGKAFARREELGTIAGRNCSYSIITEEDYGEEDVNKICSEIAEHVEAAGGKCEIITDRVEAIKKAISLMDDDTMLFLPGKGRETREKRGNAYIDTPSDAAVVEKYL
ncbi:MAG: UDP-N-acetylmuramoyl-L-alanyl-D-glutamate--2,6-diaminopimelate ligase [Mogibacterium sp.]|nr:UDP-N-acetylmuramoyl-L-alanyl-D-glutamate--2,6-diaminopimelate ligase [Mogibacterium sp.]